MKKIIFLTLILLTFACAKHTTPRKVNNKIVEGSWNMQEFIDNDASIMKKYQGISLTFSEGGQVASTSESAVGGTWSVGTQKNPAILYMTFPDEIDSMHVLSDDWVVYKLTKDECVLKRNEGVEYDYDNSLDRLTLYKIK